MNSIQNYGMTNYSVGFRAKNNVARKIAKKTEGPIADFTKVTLNDAKNLEVIGEPADFTKATLNDATNLKVIGEPADLADTADTAGTVVQGLGTTDLLNHASLSEAIKAKYTNIK